MTLAKLSSRSGSSRRSKLGKSVRKNKSKFSHESTSQAFVGDTSRFSQCTDCGENVFGLPLEPPYILKDEEFE